MGDLGCAGLTPSSSGPASPSSRLQPSLTAHWAPCFHCFNQTRLRHQTWEMGHGREKGVKVDVLGGSGRAVGVPQWVDFGH